MFFISLPALIVLAIASVTSACSPFSKSNEDNYSRVHGDSGIPGRSFAQIVDELNNLEKSYPSMAKVITYGQSVGGENLTMIRIGKNLTASASEELRPGVIIGGTIHGDEFLNIEDRLPRWFLENQQSPGVAKFFSSGGVIWIAPILNPDGYKAHRRENNRGQDLNRDFDLKMAEKKGFSQPETKSFIETLRQETAAQKVKVQITLDYHCCVGALIYPWSHSYTAELPPAEKAEEQRLAKMILEQFPGYGSGRAIEVVKYVAVGAADDFYHESFGANSFTFEGAFQREKNNFTQHTIMWDRLLADKAGNTVIDSVVTLPPVTNTTGAPTIAVMSEPAPGTLVTAAAAGVDAAAITLCRGDAVICVGGSAPEAVQFKGGERVGERTIFKSGSSDAVAVKDGEVFTLISRDAAGAILKSATFHFKAQATSP